MDFSFTEEQIAFRETARQFSEKALAPFAAEWDASSHFPKDAIRKAGELGFCSLYCDEEYGGMGLSRLDAALIFEQLSQGCTSTTAFITIHNMATWMLTRFGSDAIRARWAEALMSGEKLASYCLTEPGSGSDAAALSTRAERTNENYVMNGTKAFISGGSYSDAYIVMCRTGDQSPKGISALVVEAGSQGLSYGALEEKMGWRSQPTAQVQFDDCTVSIDNLLGDEGQGFSYAMAGLDGGRLNIAASALGGAQAALSATLEYMGQRKAFGKSIDQFQALQFKLAEMEVKLQSSRTFLRQAAWKLDNSASDAGKFCAMAKLYVTDCAFEVANSCLQLHGGYGYLSDYGIEKIVRDLRVHQILEGTNEIMRMIISRHMLAAR